MSSRSRVIAAMGDVNQVHTWSGTPYHFLKAAERQNFASRGIPVDITREKLPRILWNFKEVLRGRKGGYQYSNWHLSRLEAQLNSDLLESDILTFNQHFPRYSTIRRYRGLLSHYIDAPFASLVNGQGLDVRLPKATIERAMRIERENFQGSQRIITMARWAAEAVSSHYPSVDLSKIHTVLPGANFDLPNDWRFRPPEEPASSSYDLVLGFVGKDWKRKGLPLLFDIQSNLRKRGYKVLIKVAGHAPRWIHDKRDVDYVGFIDKNSHPRDFAQFISECDIGCLFSSREALGISTLEFLRAGIPVAGYAHEGLADTLPKSASLRFQLNDHLETLTNAFERFIKDSDYAQRLRARAIEISPLVTWDRCVNEIQAIWENQPFAPLRLWEL